MEQYLIMKYGLKYVRRLKWKIKRFFKKLFKLVLIGGAIYLAYKNGLLDTLISNINI